MECRYTEITAGIAVCEKLKEYFHSGTPWHQCAREIAIQLAQLRRKAEVYYPDSSPGARLHHVAGFSRKDMLEMLEMPE